VVLKEFSVSDSKEIEALEALEAILEMLSKKEIQLTELANELDKVKVENEKLRSTAGAMEKKVTPQNEAPDTGTTVRKILIIDHVAMFRMNLASILNANGFQVIGEIGCPDESSIMEMLLLKSPSIVSIDYHMPGLNCVKMIKRIKGARPDIKVVIISAELSHEALYSLLRAGANDFVTKPVQQSRLVSVLRGLYVMPV
jgi:two-component system, chemotaxis family, chemotaxis protein CheY